VKIINRQNTFIPPVSYSSPPISEQEDRQRATETYEEGIQLILDEHEETLRAEESFLLFALLTNPFVASFGRIFSERARKTLEDIKKRKENHPWGDMGHEESCTYENCVRHCQIKQLKEQFASVAVNIRDVKVTSICAIGSLCLLMLVYTILLLIFPELSLIPVVCFMTYLAVAAITYVGGTSIIFHKKMEQIPKHELKFYKVPNF